MEEMKIVKPGLFGGRYIGGAICFVIGAGVWIFSSHSMDNSEPWDGSMVPYYLAVLFVGGFVAGLLQPNALRRLYFWVCVGQFVGGLLTVGLEIVIGLFMIVICSLPSLFGAYIGSLLRTR